MAQSFYLLFGTIGKVAFVVEERSAVGISAVGHGRATCSRRQRDAGAGAPVWLLTLVACLGTGGPTATAAPSLAEPRHGEVRYEPAENEAMVAEIFRLPAQTFVFDQQFVDSRSSRYELSLVTFPSPVETPHANNNTVHCEYFRPVAPGQHPGVVVLHILGGDFELSRLFCKQLALHDVGALFLKLPYYGERKQPGVDIEMISADPHQTYAGMRQGILDIRRAAGWLRAQSEIDPADLGVMGISLGGITGALAGTAEPRFGKMFLMLAGGDLSQIGWDSEGLPELKEAREKWLASGRTKEELFELLAPIDPARYGANVRGRKILMLNADHDEIVPKACTEALWRAFGEPEILWLDAGHYSAMRYIPGALEKAAKFFSAPAHRP